MGSLNDFFKYVNAAPTDLKETVESLSHISVTENLKEARRIFRKKEFSDEEVEPETKYNDSFTIDWDKFLNK